MLILIISFLISCANLSSGGDIHELQSIIIAQGKDCSSYAQSGDYVSYHYIGTFYSNGEKFDSSFDRDQPYRFTIDRGEVIAGMNEGIKGMCVGEKRVISIPSSMAYGARGYPPVIPEDSDLVFQVEMLSIVKKSEL